MIKLTMIGLLLVNLALVGCGSSLRPAPTSTVNMTLEIEPNSPSVGPSHLTVTLTDPAGQPVEGAAVQIEGAMSHAGMSPRWAKARAAANGSYEAPFVWSMGGDWTVTVTASLPDGQQLARQFALTVAGESVMEDHAASQNRLPNNGAVVRLVSPQAGETFEVGREIIIEIETEQFKLGEAGNHWHVYVDGRSPQMVMGRMTETLLRDLEPGQHEISVYLSRGSHQDLAGGDTVIITVIDPAAAADLNAGLEEPHHHHAGE